jgi:metallo-beta-lactamase family protein
LPDHRSTVVLAGYQAAGTRGRTLLEGARQLKMYGRYVPVRAEIVDLTGLSQHADAGELVQWACSAATPPSTTFVVHGEEQASDALAGALADRTGELTVVPRLGERVLL